MARKQTSETGDSAARSSLQDVDGPRARGFKHDPRRWAEVAMDFLKAGNLLDAQISLQACIDSFHESSRPIGRTQPLRES